MGINSTWECCQLVTDLNKELYWIHSHSYQIIESSFSQKFYYASLRDRLKEGPQWVNCVVLITTLLQHCAFQEYVFNGQSLAIMLASSWWSMGQDMGFCGFGMANSESGYHNLLSSGQVPKSLIFKPLWVIPDLWAGTHEKLHKVEFMWYSRWTSDGLVMSICIHECWYMSSETFWRTDRRPHEKIISNPSCAVGTQVSSTYYFVI